MAGVVGRGHPREANTGVAPTGEPKRTVDLADPQSPDGNDVLTPPTRAHWRRWLTANDGRQAGLWVVYRKKGSGLEGPVYDDLVEEALCFGWIDSQARRVDDGRMMQWFSPRRPGGLWSPSTSSVSSD